jgi:hypothetical protein
MFLSYKSGCPVFARSYRAKVGLRVMGEPFSLPGHKNPVIPTENSRPTHGAEEAA